jgi:hypothetical protein
VDPIPEITNSRTDVTSHKRATPKTSLLSRAVWRSRILFSLCNFMSINNRCPDTRFRLHPPRKKQKNYLLRRAEFFFFAQQLQKEYTGSRRKKFFKEIACILEPGS